MSNTYIFISKKGLHTRNNYKPILKFNADNNDELYEEILNNYDKFDKILKAFLEGGGMVDNDQSDFIHFCEKYNIDKKDFLIPKNKKSRKIFLTKYINHVLDIFPFEEKIVDDHEKYYDCIVINN
jgi:hypothetical protein